MIWCGPPPGRRGDGAAAAGGKGGPPPTIVRDLHIAATPPLNPPHLLSEWMPAVVNGWTVGAGPFNMLEASGQVNGMIEGFLRHHV